MFNNELRQVIHNPHGEIAKLGVAPTCNHFAFVAFEFDVTVQHNFTDPQYHGEIALKSSLKVNIMHLPSALGTRADIADYLKATKVFAPEGGGRPDAKNYMFVFLRPMKNHSILTEH